MTGDTQQNAYDELFTETYLADEAYETFDIAMPDDLLDKMLVQSLDKDVDYWRQKPWNLEEVDKTNVNFLLGEQLKNEKFIEPDTRYIDNRMFSATRAILSYATGRLAVPEIVPSRSDEQFEKMARNIQGALYQHSLDENVEHMVRAAVLNLLVRKRGYLKLRYDPNAGLYGDVITEVVDPADIIISRTAGYMKNPDKIYHRIRCTVEELCSKYPKKQKDIWMAYGIKKGVFTQLSKYVTYFECWFTYLDSKNVPREGLCSFLPDHHIILDKGPNPNWIYSGSDEKEKKENVTFTPPKPFVSFNYLSLGNSFIDETCLFEQGRPQQEMLNKRGRQIWENADFVNGRWVASKKAFTEEDGQKMINKGPKTVAMTNAEDVRTALMNVASPELPSYVYNTLLDARNEIDTMMGTPSVFRGSQPESQDTLGRDLLVKQQAGMLQDDLVRAVEVGMEMYYKIKLQLWRVFYTDDYWFQVKGGDGKFDFILLNGDNIDSNVKIGVEIDSTLPLDKADVRNTAIELAKMGRIDQLTLLEDLGVPEPEIRTERLLRSQMDPYGYMSSVEQSMDNNDAEVDIALLIDGKDPQERDEYDEGYLSYFNQFLTKQRFAVLPADAKQRLVQFLIVVQHLVTQSANLQGITLNDAGITTAPPAPPMPKKTEQIKLAGTLDPQTSQQLSGVQAPAPTQQAPPPQPGQM